MNDNNRSWALLSTFAGTRRASSSALWQRLPLGGEALYHSAVASYTKRGWCFISTAMIAVMKYAVLMRHHPRVLIFVTFVIVYTSACHCMPYSKDVVCDARRPYRRTGLRIPQVGETMTLPPSDETHGGPSKRCRGGARPVLFGNLTPRTSSILVPLSWHIANYSPFVFDFLSVSRVIHVCLPMGLPCSMPFATQQRQPSGFLSLPLNW